MDKHLPPCRDCEKAAKELWHGVTAGCRGCECRSIARSPQFFRVRKRQHVDSAYLAMLAAVLHVDPKEPSNWRPAHEDVKRAFGSDAMYAAWRAREAA